MSTQSQRALLLRRSAAEFERWVNAILDYAETCLQAPLSELEAEARPLSRDCFAPAPVGAAPITPQPVIRAQLGAAQKAVCKAGHLW